MTDTQERLRSTLEHVAERTTIADDGLERLAARHRRGRRVGRLVPAVAMAAAVALVVVVTGQMNRPSPDVAVEPADPGPGTVSGDSLPADGAPAEGWEDLTLDEAIARLIDANGQAPQRPRPGPGQAVIDRTYAIWGAGSVDPGGEVTHSLELTFYEQQRLSNGQTRIVREALAEVAPTADPAAMRAEVKRRLAEVDLGTVLRRSELMDGGDPLEMIKALLVEAKRQSRGNAEPREGSTERPDQAHAFMGAADVLRLGLEPADRIQALQIIDRLDDGLTEYRGVVHDLLGREGVGIAGLDQGIWNVLIFDPVTGDLLGELVEVPADAGFTEPPITTYTAREVVVESVAGR